MVMAKGVKHYLKDGKVHKGMLKECIIKCLMDSYIAAKLMEKIPRGYFIMENYQSQQR
jgi:hypothetical protein